MRSLSDAPWRAKTVQPDMQALLFDCDGVLVDTERDGHRVAFNQAFAAKGLGTHWSVDRYADLLRTAGG